MINKNLLFILIGVGIICFIASIVLRKKQRIRLFLRSLGILTAIIPLFLYIAFLLVLYIKERPFVGTYEMVDKELGNINIQLFRNNSFEMIADSCSHGFVQGSWKYVWDIDESTLLFESTSQKMGSATFTDDYEIMIKHVPVCLRLAPLVHFKRISINTTEPRDSFGY